MAIPKLFFNTVKDLPFSNCNKCNRFLLDNGVEYMIEKVLIPNDVLYEFAICSKCIMTIQQKISKESLKNMQQFSESELNNRIQKIDHLVNENYDEIKKQLSIQTPQFSYENCNIMAFFKGRSLIEDYPPVCVSTQALEKMQDVLSKKTKDSFDDFMDFTGDVPPGLEELFKTRKPVFI